MKKKSKLKTFILIIMLTTMCLIMAGCPGAVDRDEVSSGEFYRSEIIGALYSYYSVEVESRNTPTINISYQASDGAWKKNGISTGWL
jgi:hypothetical protein